MCPICTNGLVVLYDTTRTKAEHRVQQMGLNKSHLWQAKLTIFLRKSLSVGHTNSNRCPGKVSNASSTTLYFLLVFWVSHFTFTFTQIHSTAVRIAKYIFQQEAFWPMQLRCSSGTCEPKLLLQMICTVCLFKDRYTFGWYIFCYWQLIVCNYFLPIRGLLVERWLSVLSPIYLLSCIHQFNK